MPSEDLARLSASELAPRLRQRTLRVIEVAEACLARIAARDEEVRAWSFLRPEHVRAEAHRLDAAAVRGPLHGIPIGIKDVILTKDMPTQYNSPLYDNFAPAMDAACVATLRAAGALIFGKCDTVEFAAMGRRARTRNPHDLARTPGGSSSGSAAAVADLQVPVALGTQTGGSGIRPASFCGVYAMKPTWNAVSREGSKMYSASLDTLAWYGRCVSDLGLMADVFALEDANIRAVPPLERLRIGLCRTPAWPQADVATVEALAAASAALIACGATVEEIVLPPLFDDILAVHDTVMIGEGVGAFLSEFRMFGATIAPEFRRRLHDENRYSRADLVRAYDITAQCRLVFEQIAAPFDAILTASSAVSLRPVGKFTRQRIKPVFDDVQSEERRRGFSCKSLNVSRTICLSHRCPPSLSNRGCHDCPMEITGTVTGKSKWSTANPSSLARRTRPRGSAATISEDAAANRAA